MTFQFAPLFGPIPGGIELAVIVLIAILLFGANKIPKLARSTGQAMGEFKKGREEVEQELSEMRGSVEGELSPETTESAESGAASPSGEAETAADADAASANVESTSEEVEAEADSTDDSEEEVEAEKQN